MMHVRLLHGCARTRGQTGVGVVSLRIWVSKFSTGQFAARMALTQILLWTKISKQFANIIDVDIKTMDKPWKSRLN